MVENIIHFKIMSNGYNLVFIRITVKEQCIINEQKIKLESFVAGGTTELLEQVLSVH